MTEVLPANHEIIKAGSKLSNSAKMLSAFMASSGEYEAKRLSEILDIPIRTIQRLKVEIGAATHGASSGNAENATSATHGAKSQNGTNAISATHGVSSAVGGVSLVRADSNIITLREKVTDSQSREDENIKAAYAELKAKCNGSTEPMLADAMRFMGGQADREHAIKWLAGTVSAFGHERTIQAWTTVVSKASAKALGNNPLAYWSKTAGGMTPSQPKAQPTAAYKIPENIPRFARPATEH